MKKQSAGILLYRMSEGGLELMLVHPGGPLWKNKDEGAWSIPKGEFTDDEDTFEAALREFHEETGTLLDAGAHFITLQPVKQKSGKIIYAFAAEQSFDVSTLTSNLFEMEWPPRSGKKASFEEVDRAAWFDIETAKRKIIPGQVPMLVQLEEMLIR